MDLPENDRLEISPQDLWQLYLLKHSNPKTAGWAVQRRLKFGYFKPSDYYEALVQKLVTSQTHWIDVGGGRALFPNNQPLSYILSKRARRLVVVDPSDNVDSNPFAHERVKCFIEQYQTDERFDLATLRMVAEHVTSPFSFVLALNRLLRHGGMVVILTVNRWSPVSIVSQVVPFSLHHPIKQFFWHTKAEDTFPTVYKMNTRRQLRVLFGNCGFKERYFAYLDDLSVFSRFKFLNYMELLTWRTLKRFGMRYPENCILGAWQKTKNVV